MKKVSFYFVWLGILALFLFWGFTSLMKKVNETWVDPNSWSTESRIVLPKETSALKVKNTMGELQSNGSQEFSFEADYCYLYQIEATETTAKLKCSLLPMYYAKRSEEIIKTWNEKSDILLVVKPEDAEPSEFLGRIDKSFKSVSALGSYKLPVKITIQGTSQYPGDTLLSRINHFLYVIDKGKQPVEVKITSYSVKRLDDATAEQKHEYAVAKTKEIWKEIEGHVNLEYKTYSDYQKLLNSYRDVLYNYRELCTDLSKCVYGYKANPGDQFVYYLFLLKSRDTARYDYLFKTIRNNYPFVPRKVADGQTCPTCGDNWIELAPGMFPVCPINDVKRGKTTQNADILFKKMDVRFEKTLKPKSYQDAENLMKMYSPTSFITDGMWDSDQIVAINYACDYVLRNNISPNSSLSKKLVTNYYAMLQTMLGVPLDQSRATFDDIIYESNAFSPYKTNLVLDYAIMRDRELSRMEPVLTAVDQYTDIRSLWNTLILLYLYEE